LVSAGVARDAETWPIANAELLKALRGPVDAGPRAVVELSR